MTSDGTKLCRFSIYESELERLKRLSGTLTGNVVAAIETYDPNGPSGSIPCGPLVQIAVPLPEITYKKLNGLFSNDPLGDCVSQYLRGK